MFAYLKSLAPVAKANKPHALAFPFDQPVALAVWRALFFRPGRFENDVQRTPQWNRGAYLVETLGHCNACHSRRNVFGATVGPLDLAGGLIPIQNWYAPSLQRQRRGRRRRLARRRGRGLAQDRRLGARLDPGADGRGGRALDPVPERRRSRRDGELPALARVGDVSGAPSRPVATATATTHATARERGAELYTTHCAACHGEDGAGVAGAYPRLAGNRAVMLSPPANLVHMVRQGGFPPVTAGNRRPFGMPPYATVLSDDDIAKVLTHLRSSWGQTRRAGLDARGEPLPRHRRALRRGETIRTGCRRPCR